MPTKAVAYTQQPVGAADIIDINLHRVSGGIRVTSIYEVKDQVAAIQKTATIIYTVANFGAFSGADLLSRINAQEGT